MDLGTYKVYIPFVKENVDLLNRKLKKIRLKSAENDQLFTMTPSFIRPVYEGIRNTSYS